MAAVTTQAIDHPKIHERERVLALLRAQEPELRALGIMRLRLFGSIARGEARPDSDVDLLAEIDHDFKFSLIDHVGLEHDLADLLERRVDLSTAPWKMRTRMRKRVEGDAIEVF
jgi:predicted nucleotidyltransferase